MKNSKAVSISILPIILSGLFEAILYFLIVYIGFAFINGLEWSTEISRTYVLLIIRAIVVTILAIPSLFVVPFKFGVAILYYGKFADLLGFVIGCFKGTDRNG